MEFGGQIGALYPSVVDEGPQRVTAYVEIPHAGSADDLPPPCEWSALPATQCAVLTHVGSYDSIAATYRSLGAWVARYSNDAGLSVREVYLVGPPDTHDPRAYETEIHWPVSFFSATSPTNPPTGKTLST